MDVTGHPKGFALRFISGKYQGGEFPLKIGREIVIGRSSDLDMVLVEDMVSRKHAKISAEEDQIVIQDLGSTNGTFVNGEKVKRVRLREGDRILIGTSIIKLVAIDGDVDAVASMQPGQDPTGQRAPRSVKRTVTGARSMAGSIDEIPLPDLLQLLSTSKKSGTLELQTDDGVGRIFLRQGQVYYAALEGVAIENPHKALYRILRWESGVFELQPPDDRTFEQEIEDSTEGLLMEAMRQIDEINRFKETLPELGAKIQLAQPMPVPLRDLSPGELDIVQIVMQHETLADVIDHHPKTDLDAYEAVAQLLSKGMIESDPK
ncbi:MAG: DUF4388 domain-containing protein [Deltaproteobacteria bacterium]|nr:DUF4388 domain-containing protein [Deltaproteobacteria bacterium]